MLKDAELVKTLEEGMLANGVLDTFIAQNGPIYERLIVDVGNPPEKANIELSENEHAFVGTFDSTDCEIGIVFNTETLSPASGVWVSRQKEDAQPPEDRHVELFAETLMASIGEDKKISMPFVTFVAENGKSLKIDGGRYKI